MSSVDQRVVEMKFNNSAFSKGITDTLSALQKLQDGLKLSGASQGAAEAAGGLGQLGSKTGILGTQFSAMSAIALGALASIGAKAVAVGQQMLSSFTTAPIMAGFQEYELKMGSIQTILANTARHGTGLEQVTASLDELNTYADKTIYNFGDMTRNIGLFTNAGITVEDATTMIKGFSNAAAASGTSAEGAAGAAYQLSQALSTGTIRLMDWRSLSNVGMGNKNMQDGIIGIAEAMGTFSGTGSTATSAASDFNGSLEDGWLSSEVMSTYLKIMSGDMDDASIAALGLTEAQVAMYREQANTGLDAATKVRTFTQLMGTLKEAVGSGWSETFGILIGDFNEATDLFTNINNSLSGLVGGMSASRNELLQSFVDLGGRTVVIEALRNIFVSLGSVLSTIGAAFRSVFPPTTAEQLMGMANSFLAFSQAITPSAETLDKLKRTFAGLFAIVGIVWELVKAGAGFFADLLGSVSGAGGGILGFTANIGDFLVSLHNAIKSGDVFGKVFDSLAAGAQFVIRAFQAVTQWIGSMFDGVRGMDAGVFSEIFAPMEEAGGRISTMFNNVVDVLRTVGGAIADFVGSAIGWFSQLGSVFEGNGWEFNADTIMQALGIGVGAGFLVMLNNLRSTIGSFDIFGGAGGGFLGSIQETLGGLTDVLGAMQANLRAEALLKIAGAIAVLALSVFLLAGLDSDGLLRATAALTAMFIQLGAAMAVFEKIGSERQAAKLVVMSVGLGLLAVAILILTVAVKNLADLNWNELAKGLVGVTVLLAALAGAVQLMSGSDVKMIRTAAGLILLAVAVRILVGAVKDLADMDWVELAKGLVGVGVLLGALALFTKFAEADSGGLKQGIGLILLAVALKILASAVGDFAKYNWEELAQGMVGIGVGLALIAGALNLMPSNSLVKAASIAVVALALSLLADAVGAFAAYNWEELSRGMAAIAVGLTVISLALRMIPTGAIFSAAAILLVAASLSMIADALQEMSQMSWGELVTGLVGLAAALGIIAIALNFMVGSVGGAFALLIVAGALTVLLPVIQGFAAMTWGELLQGLAGLAGVFIILGVAGMLLAPVSLVLLAVGAAILMLGAGVVLAAAGVMLFSVALTALAAAGAVGAAALGLIITTLLGLIPYAMTMLAAGIIAFAEVIATGAPALIGAFVAVLTALLQAIVDITPQIAQTMLTLLTALLNVITRAVPQMVNAGMTILIGFLNGIASRIGEVVNSATDVIVNFLNGIARNMPRIIQAGVNLIISFMEGLRSAIPQIVNAGMSMIGDVVSGIVSAIGNQVGRLGSEARRMARAIIDGIVNGITNLASMAWNAITDLAGNLLDGAMSALGINSPSKEFMYLGQYVSQGMAIGIENHAYKATRASTAMGNDLIGTMGKTISGLSDMISGMDDLTPVITPVLDLSEIRRGSGQISDMLNGASIDLSNIKSSTGSASAGYSANLSALADLVAENAGVHQNFTQINNSPKALSSADIYRQTNNQISQAKGALTNVN